VRLAVEELRIAHATSRVGPHVTISVGLAQLEIGRTPDFDTLFDAADQALYRAKQNGRNRVESSGARSPSDAA